MTAIDQYRDVVWIDEFWWTQNPKTFYGTYPTGEVPPKELRTAGPGIHSVIAAVSSKGKCWHRIIKGSANKTDFWLFVAELYNYYHCKG